MRFAEFHAGQTIDAGPHVPSEAEIVAFARDWDPQWFHTHAEHARAGRFGGLIASGWHTCSIAMRLLVDAALHGSESFASPGIAYIRWPNPVRPGVALRVRATVLDVRRSNARPNLGILRWRWQMHDAHDLEVLDLEATSLFDLTAPAPAAAGERADPAEPADPKPAGA